MREEGFGGERVGVKGVEYEVAASDADGLEGLVRRGGVDFVLPVE